MKSIFVFLLFLTQIGVSQITNSIYPAVPYSDLQHIAVDGDYIFTSGDCDVVMLSSNGGVDWTSIEFTESIVDVKIDPTSGGSAAFYMTRDDVFMLEMSEMNFEKVSNNALNLMAGTLRGLETKGDQVFVLSGAAVFQSQVGQYDWTKLADLNFNDNNDYLRTSDRTDNHIYVGSDLGELKRVNLESGNVESLFDFANRISKIEMVTDEIGYADVSGQSAFVRTTNGGTSWSSLTGMPEKINPVAYGENIIMSVNTNRLYVSMDAGITSTYVPIPEDGYADLISAACMTDNGSLYLSGRSSMVLRTDDFAASFINLNKYKRANLSAIRINGTGPGYATGASGSLIKTTDNGVSWESIDVGLDDGLYVNGLAFYPDGRVLLAHDDGLIILQDDVIVDEMDIPTSILFQSNNGNVLIAIQTVSGSNAVTVSTDRGMTWASKAMVPNSYYKIHQSPTGKIYIPSGEALVYTSVDNGESWEIEEFGFTNVRSVSFLDDENGIFTNDGKLYKTSDGGQTALEIASAFAIDNIYYFNADQIFFTTAQNAMTTIFESENGGSNFTTKGNYCSSTRASYYDGAKTIWLAQNGGHINKHVFATLTNSTSKINTEEITVFPNPLMNGQKLFLPKEISAGTNLKILDLSGNLVLYKHLSHQVSSVSLDDLVPGYYILELSSDNIKSYGKLMIH